MDFLVTRGFIRGRGLIVERPGVPNARARRTHPRHPGDIGDIGDIFRKPLKMQGFLNSHTGDISGDIFGDGDSHAQDTLGACVLRWRLDAGNPYCEQWALRRCSDARPPVLVVPKAPTVSVLAKGTDCNLTAVNAFLGNVLETSRIQFINHPLARA